MVGLRIDWLRLGVCCNGLHVEYRVYPSDLRRAFMSHAHYKLFSGRFRGGDPPEDAARAAAAAALQQHRGRVDRGLDGVMPVHTLWLRSAQSWRFPNSAAAFLEARGMASLLASLYAFVEVLVDWNGGTYYTSTVPVPVKARTSHAWIRTV